MAERPQREKFHHGDVRHAAIRAVRAMLQDGQDGQAISLRAVARTIGVAHRALYNHFPDKAGLLRAVAAEGFEELTALLQKAENREETQRRYLDFAMAAPALYEVMMREPAADLEAGDVMHEPIQAFIKVAVARLAPREADGLRQRRTVMRHWMVLHGGLTLYRAGMLSARTPPQFVDEMLAIVGE